MTFKIPASKANLAKIFLVTAMLCWSFKAWSEPQEIDRLQLAQENYEARKLMRRVEKLSDEGRLGDALKLLEQTKVHVKNSNRMLRVNELSSKYETKLQEKEKKEESMSRELDKQQKLLEVDTYWKPPKPWETEIIPEESKKVLPIEERARRRIPLIDFKDATLKEVVEFLARAADINIVIDEKSVPVGDRMTVYLKDIPMIEALNFVLKSKKLSTRTEENLILITTPENLGDDLEVRVYDVQDLVGKLHDFPSAPFEFGEITKKTQDSSEAGTGGEGQKSGS